jgi:hypothetical protein
MLCKAKLQFNLRITRNAYTKSARKKIQSFLIVKADDIYLVTTVPEIVNIPDVSAPSCTQPLHY